VILGIYKRNRPSAPWLLVSTAYTAEVAKQDKLSSLAKAKKEGKPEAEVAIQIFDTKTWIPDSLKKIEEDERLFYN
jgi:hypothetical protein